MQNMNHLIFYDGNCPLCNLTVRFLLRVDKKESFLFAPLEGETAAAELKEHPHLTQDLDTLVLLEHYSTPQQQLLYRGKAALRIAWYLGGVWRLLGWLSFLPSFPFDLIYRIIARNRYRIFKEREQLSEKNFEHRFRR